MKTFSCDNRCSGWWFRPIESIQHCLREISKVYTNIPQLMITGVFDAATREAVSAFQQEFELAPSGEVDFETWQLLVLVYQNLEAVCTGRGCYNLGVPQGEIVVLKQGDGNCCQLEILQAVLNHFAKEYANMPEVQTGDGYNASTAAAVQNFQHVSGLPESGVLDRRTWNTLLRAYNNCITQKNPPV